MKRTLRRIRSTVLGKRFSLCFLCTLLWCLTNLLLAQHDYARFEEYELFRYHAATAQTSYQVVLDVEDPCFEILSGEWTLAKTGTYLHYYYWTIDGPGTGAGRARWIAEGLPTGIYLVEFWADYGDYAGDARYQVISADGVTTVVVDMNYISAGWHTLGSFTIDHLCVVNVSDYWSGSGTKLSVDALRFTLSTSLPAPPATTVPPHIGICIDDVGAANPTQSWQPIYKMLRLPFTMSFAVLPYQTYTIASAEEIDTHGSEVLMHQPMAAITVPNPGAGGITDGMTLEQVRSTVATNLDSLPHVVGMNNHMGSLITQQTDKMQVCMEELEERQLFFYDSRTITTSVAYEVAKENGLLTGERDLFIDGSTKEEAKDLIRSLAERALHAPEVPHLAIGHVYSRTADALEEMAPELAAMGVEVWPLSRCIAQVVEADYTPAGCSFSTAGNWTTDEDDAMSKQLYNGHAMIVSDPAATRTDSAVFTPSLPVDGEYDIYAIWSGDSSNTPEGSARVYHFYGVTEVPLNQSGSINEWQYLGRYPCLAGSGSRVTLSDSACTTPEKVFRADAVKYVYAGFFTFEPSSAQVWMLY